MAAHAYALRSKLNNSSVSLKNSPSNSPFSKTGTRTPRKPNTSNASLSLQHVIGTTTTGPSGFCCHANTNIYAYCAGSAVVLAKVEADGQVSQRFFKARPIASSINPCISVYDQSTPTGTSKSRRKSVLPARLEGYGSTPTGSPFREWSDDGNGQTWTARERIKAASSVSISPDGRLLAVGETGYNPRVLIFSTAEDAVPSLPVSIMSEHTYGVRSLAFSLDGKYLATLGDVNDGFLFMWSINAKTGSVKLHSTNRCTTIISDMIWCGSTLVTVGTRHIKAWKVSQPIKPSPSKRPRLRSEETGPATPGPQTLTGRNVLLGSLVDETFTCAVAISDIEAVVCTDSGHVCILKDGDRGIPTLRVVRQVRNRITCVAYDKQSGKISFGDRQGILQIETFAAITNCDLITLQDPKVSVLHLSPESRGSAVAATALGALQNHIVVLDADCNCALVSLTPSEPSITKIFASHGDSVRGLRLLHAQEDDKTYFTWSAAGEVMFWDRSGRLARAGHIFVDQIPSLDEDFCNELKVVRQISKSNYYVSGDRLGILKLLKSQNLDVIKEIRAHGSEIIDIAVHEGQEETFVATSGRDRTVQLFRFVECKLDLTQTLDEHIGAVTEVCFTSNGDRLLSASADRTIIVRDRFTKDLGTSKVTAYLSTRVITLKATPLSMSLLFDDADGLIVSTMDRNVLRLTISTGAISDAFKVTDPENDDTAILSSICMGKSRVDGAPRLLVGCSSTDKSIRVYDLDREILLTREAGHTEGISEVALREEVNEAKSAVTRSIISTGLDGTIMTWNLVLTPPNTLSMPLQELSQGQAVLGFESGGTPIKPSPTSLPPLRKVLTNVDIAQFTGGDSVTSSPVQASLRSVSPSRLRRRTSRLTLAHSSIDEDEAVVTPIQRSPTSIDRRRAGYSTVDSPSPPPPSGLQKQRSQGDLRSQLSRPELRSSRTTPYRRSPSPTGVDLPASMPTTPRINVANNGKVLRRAPSVPSELRGQAMRQRSRRQSVTIPSSEGAGELGSMAMASEQACHMLQTFRTKVSSTVERGFDWDEVENELQKTLNAVRVKKVAELYRGNASERSTSGDVTQMTNESSISMLPAGSETSDVEGLRMLLERARVDGGEAVRLPVDGEGGAGAG